MLLFWIWLANLPGLPEWIKGRLLESFRDPEEVYYCHQSALAQVEGVRQEHLQALENKDLQEAKAILDSCNRKGISILTMADDRYPEKLRHIQDPPVVIYYRGVLPKWEEVPAIGVVGTRKASAYGLQVARQMGNQIAQCGGLVVSGGASGIDTKALEGALETQAPVVCVLGCGVDVIYPRMNRRLFSKIQQQGCLISEYPPQTQPVAWHFLRRNRIISGISDGVLVVEAPVKSGALNTAHHAKEQGRDLFAVPANLGVANFEGSNTLLEEGAMAALSGWRVVQQYQQRYPDAVRQPTMLPSEHPQTLGKVAQEPMIPRNAGKNFIDNKENTTYYRDLEKTHQELTPQEQEILALLDRTPQHSDAVAAQADMPPAKVQAILTRLTVKGLVLFHGGGRVSLK